VTVSDDEAPVFTNCPTTITKNAIKNTDSTLVSWNAVNVVDNVDSNVFPVRSHNSGDEFFVGTTVVTFTATDAASNAATCSFNVVVLDVDAPSFTNCPSSSISGTTDPGSNQGAVTWAAITASDVVDGSVSVVSSHNSGDLFDVGSTSVSVNTSDVAGNENVCSFTVVIVDDEIPSWSNCPSDISSATDEGQTTGTVSWTAPTASDNVGVISTASSHSPGTAFSYGSTTVTYTATDAEGLDGTCSFSVVITDADSPVFDSCPTAVTATTDPGLATAVVTFIVSASDAVDGSVTPVLTSGSVSGSAFPVGVTTESFSATDNDGNSATCSFTVTVTDNEKPAISGCPSDIVTATDTGVNYATPTWTSPSATDNVAVTQFTSTDASNDQFDLGVSTVTYTARDAKGNIQTCSFTVTVNDDEAPVWSNCPSDIAASPGLAGVATVTWADPVASDNVALASATSTYSSGEQFVIGVYNVIYTASDDAANIATCSFQVNITDGDECTPNPCLNGGICSDLINSYSCDCSAVDYTGSICDIQTDDCASNPCQNGGTCSDLVNDYSCACVSGFTDKGCQTDVEAPTVSVYFLLFLI
jgi:hypothetical protein